MKAFNPASKHTKLIFILVTTSILPIFIFATFIPPYANSSSYAALEDIIDLHLFDKVGAWSSLFPFTAKVISNYINLAVPFFTLLILILIQKAPPSPTINLQNLSLRKYLFVVVSLPFLDWFFIYQSYFSFTNFATHNLKFRIFGQHIVFFSFMSSILMLNLYIFAFLNYAAFYLIPHNYLKNKINRH